MGAPATRSRPMREWVTLVALVVIGLQCKGAESVIAPPPAATSKLAFVRTPIRSLAGRPLDSIIVQTVDAQGAPVATSGAVITIAIRAVSGVAPSLVGSLSATSVNGVASFAGLAIAGPGAGLTLVATAAGFTPATSTPFQIDASPVAIDSSSVPLAGDSAGRAAGTYVFQASPTTPVADSGSVIVGAEKGGFIRRVVRAQRAGNTITYETVQANLDEVMQNDSVSVRLNNPDAATFRSDLPGLSGSNGSYVLTNTVLTGTAADGVVLSNAAIQVTPTIDFSAVWGVYAAKSVHLSVATELAFSASVQVSVPGRRELSGTLPLGTLQIPFSILVGSVRVPAAFVIPITLEWTLNAAGQGAMQLGWTSSGRTTVGADWSKTGGFTPIRAATFNISPQFPSPSVLANVATQLALRTTPRLVIAGVSAGELRAQPLAEGSALADLPANRWTTTCRSAVQLAIGLNPGILGQGIGEFANSATLVESDSPGCARTGFITTPRIAFSAPSVSFTAPGGGANPSTQNVQVTNGGTGTLSALSVGTVAYGAGQPGGWLNASLNGATAPAALVLAATTGTRPVGTYTATVPVVSAASGVTNSPQNVSVTFVVTTPPAPVISLSSSALAFAAVAGTGNPASQKVVITNGGTGTLSAVSIDPPLYGPGQPIGWLVATLSGPTAPDTVTLAATTGTLPAGTYTATMAVKSAAGGVTNSPQTISISFTVAAAPAPTIALSSSSLTFAATAGGASPAAQQVSVTNSGTGTLSDVAVDPPVYGAGQPTGWIAVSLSGPTAPNSATFTATTGALAAGTYNATVSVKSSASGVTNSPQTVSVTFTVAAAPAPTIALSSSALSFSATAGAGNPATQTVTITNSGTGTLTDVSLDPPVYAAGQPVGWLGAILSGPAAPNSVTFTASTGALAAGTYSASVAVKSSASGVTNSPRTVDVTFTVAAAPAPAIALSASALTFGATAGGGNPPAQSVTITNGGTGTLSDLALDPPLYGIGQPTGWLATSLAGSTAPSSATFTPSTGALAAGTYTATVAVKSSAAGVTNSPQPVSVTFTVTAPAPSVTLTGSQFVPPSIVVAPGATVDFTNLDGFSHNVTFADAGITSVPNFSSGTRAVTMPVAVGTYTYRCTLHAGMTGSVKVE